MRILTLLLLMIVFQKTPFPKIIMNEYANKLRVGMPIYKTNMLEDVFPYFLSSVDFNGRNYIGNPAKKKRDAEQLAARAAILSLLGNILCKILLIFIS